MHGDQRIVYPFDDWTWLPIIISLLRLFSSVLLLLSLQHVVTTEGKTLLPQYLGMYRLTVNNAETYWIVMRNVFSSMVKIHRKFDLKGSTVDRAASNKEKVSSQCALKLLVLLFLVALSMLTISCCSCACMVYLDRILPTGQDLPHTEGC